MAIDISTYRLNIGRFNCKHVVVTPHTYIKFNSSNNIDIYRQSFNFSILYIIITSMIFLRLLVFKVSHLIKPVYCKVRSFSANTNNISIRKKHNKKMKATHGNIPTISNNNYVRVNSGYKIMQLNIQSLRNKLSEIVSIIDNFQPHILALTECEITDNAKPFECGGGG